jgi:hypothetical protein
MDFADILVRLLDFLVIGFALASGWLWLAASRRRLRRVSKHETLDAADYNRIITALNRTQILNSRAALATALAAFMAALRIICYEIFGN